VLDTNVVLSALLWNGAPSRLLVAQQQGTLELFTSEALVEELRDVLLRAKCAKRLLEGNSSAYQLLSLYVAAASLVHPVSVPRTAPDPDDDVVIGTALAARANLIVTGDKALLSVGVYEGGRIVTVSEALSAAALNSS